MNLIFVLLGEILIYILPTFKDLINNKYTGPPCLKHSIYSKSYIVAYYLFSIDPDI